MMPEVESNPACLAEMYGFVLASAELGFVHEQRFMTALPPWSRDDLPFVHYCAPSFDSTFRWRWSKHEYRPWERVNEPPAKTSTLSNRRLISLLNELAEMKGFQVQETRKEEKDSIIWV